MLGHPPKKFECEELEEGNAVRIGQKKRYKTDTQTIFWRNADQKC